MLAIGCNNVQITIIDAVPYSAPDLVLEEWFDKVDDGVNQWAHVDHMHFLQLYWVGFLKLYIKYL